MEFTGLGLGFLSVMYVMMGESGGFEPVAVAPGEDSTPGNLVRWAKIITAVTAAGLFLRAVMALSSSNVHHAGPIPRSRWECMSVASFFVAVAMYAVGRRGGFRVVIDPSASESFQKKKDYQITAFWLATMAAVLLFMAWVKCAMSARRMYSHVHTPVYQE